jgi:hypothetical protein
VITAWIKAGTPGTASKPVGGYDQWSHWCREPLC